MKKSGLAIIFATVFTFLGASCDSGLFAEKGEMGFVVNCDYGRYVQGKATYLLGGSSVFFNLDEYDIQQLVLGDVVTVEYTGDMLLQGNDPSKIEITGKVKEIEVERAEVVSVKYDGITVVLDGKTTLKLEDIPQYVIKDRAGNFAALEECQANVTLYATYREERVTGKTIYLDGLYAYNPRK